jgi:hypothetical protein
MKSGKMKTLKERIADVASYLQSLMAPEVFPKVQEAVERKDKNLLMKVCRKAKIPEIYLGNVVSVLLSVGPEQKWPPGY